MDPLTRVHVLEPSGAWRVRNVMLLKKGDIFQEIDKWDRPVGEVLIALTDMGDAFRMSMLSTLGDNLP